MATLREHLARPGSFVVATEIVTSRGLVTPNGSGAPETNGSAPAAMQPAAVQSNGAKST